MKDNASRAVVLHGKMEIVRCLNISPLQELVYQPKQRNHRKLSSCIAESPV